MVVELFAKVGGVIPNNPAPPNKLEPVVLLLVPGVEVVFVEVMLLAPAVVAGFDRLNKLLPAVVPPAGVVPEVFPREKTRENNHYVESILGCRPTHNLKQGVL